MRSVDFETLLRRLKMVDVAPSADLSIRIALALAHDQAQRGNRRGVLQFIRYAMKGVYWDGRTSDLTVIRTRLIRLLNSAAPQLVLDSSLDTGRLRVSKSRSRQKLDVLASAKRATTAK